eukprot:5438289-Amphidinium_carterae.1
MYVEEAHADEPLQAPVAGSASNVIEQNRLTIEEVKETILLSVRNMIADNSEHAQNLEATVATELKRVVGRAEHLESEVRELASWVQPVAVVSASRNRLHATLWGRAAAPASWSTVCGWVWTGCGAAVPVPAVPPRDPVKVCQRCLVALACVSGLPAWAASLVRDGSGVVGGAAGSSA